jgi:Tol biopolymer transport system component
MADSSGSVRSSVEILDIHDGRRTLVFAAEGIYEAPNWSRDGRFLILNHDGRLLRLVLDSGDISTINTGFATRCNNDHGISPDGSEIVISHHDDASDGGSIIYRLPIDGGTPRRVTANWPSYWHGWSPDGRTLAYVAGRNGGDYKIYRIAVDGGAETQLTFGPGLDDGPDYSADGRYIYFNGFRNGCMQIWRINADGSEPKQMVESVHSDWFPHPSPDGNYLVFLRYLEDQGQAHPFGRDVQLMLLDLNTDDLRPLTDVFWGGQGSLNVPSWAPDSRQLAFVSYTRI